jgi:hypothetical protein
MKKVFTLLLAGILTVSVLTACGSEKTIVGSDATIAPYDKNQLVNDAIVIVSGEVISSEVQTDFKGFPVTDYKIKVNNVFKGNPAADVEVRTYGGETAEMKYIPDEEMVTFQTGEKVVVFLTDEKGNRPDKNDFGYFVVGQFQGKLKVENGKLKNEKFIFDTVNFTQELKNIEDQNKAKGLTPSKAATNSDI